MMPWIAQLKNRSLAFHGGLCLLLSGFLMGTLLWVGPAEAALPEESTPSATVSDAATDAFHDAVQAYRQGDYRKAQSSLEQLHQQRPEDTKVTYYLAITEAQLGRFAQAKRLYEEILTLDPQGDAADLAKIGLTYLPPESRLDLPPRFQNPEQVSTGTMPQPPGAVTNGATGNLPPGTSQQDIMAWQALMGQMGSGNSQGGMNPMMWMMPNAMGGNGANNYDPNAMSNMIMNQMLQNFNLDGGSKDNQ